MSGEISADGDGGTNYAITLSLPAAHIEDIQVRVISGVDYFSLAQLTGAGKFAKVDPSSKTLGNLLSSLQGLRPGSSFARVAPAVESLRDLGPTTIGGDNTEHYLLLIDSAKSHSLLNPGVTVPDSITSKLPKTFRYNIYVTKDDLVRRVHFELLGKATTVNYTDWGSSIHLSAPPASALVPAPAGF